MGAFGTARRFVRVGLAFLPLLWAYARDRRRFLLVGPPRRTTPAVTQRRATTLLETLLALGPTFIKIGQLLSTRPDILPPVYIEQLSQLQDDVPPAPWADTRAVIESAIGPVDERFDAFDTDAISGASLGQVYRAELDGEPVAVKVRRPGVTARVETDLGVLRLILPIILSFLDEARAFSVTNLVDEFETVIREEMDYEREARMLEEIGANFARDEGVVIPDVLGTHSTDRVLTMAYIDGTKVTDIESLEARGIDRTAVAERLERAYLQMILDDGVFHADPHPGNIAVRDDGRIVFYDFGMSGRVRPTTRQHIIDFYVAVAERDIPSILDALIALGTVSPAADRRVMGEVLELAIRDAQGERIEEWRVQEIIQRVETTMYEFPLRLPARMALVMRVATVVEGVCVTLDPDFDFIAVASAFLTERGYREESIRQAARDAGTTAGRAGLAAVRAAPKAERVLDRMDRDEAFIRAGVEDPKGTLARLAIRVAYGIVLGASLVGAAVIYAVRGIAPGVGGMLVLAGVAAWLLRRSVRSRGLGARPTFTRHELRRREER